MKDVEKFSISLPKSVYAALAKEAASHHQETKRFIRDILGDHALSNGFMEQPEKDYLMTYRELSDDVANAAIQIVQENGFQDDITARAVQLCQNDPDWLARYEEHIQGSAFETGNLRKNSLNQNIGYRVKTALNAEVALAANGTRRTRAVSGLVITSHSVLRRPN